MKRVAKVLILYFISLCIISCSEAPNNQRSTIKPGIENSGVLSYLPHIGTTSELTSDNTCGKSKQILVYAETRKYKIHICSDETGKEFKSFVISRFFNSRQTTIKNDLSISWNRSYKIHNRNFSLVLERPKRVSYFLYKPRKPKFYLNVDFADESLIEEDIEMYLFNEKFEPNYKKITLELDKKGNDLFLKALSTFHKKIRTCKIAETGDGKIPDSSTALEMGSNKYLIESICYPTGYNRIYQYYLYSEEASKQEIKIIPFDTLQSTGIGKYRKTTNYTISGYPQFFPEDNTLRLFRKGIGRGGCGSAEEYKLMDDKFELVQYRRHEDCSKPLSPEQFPVIYPSEAN